MRKALNHLRKCDPVLAELIGKVGAYKIQYGEPVFQSLVEAIIYQQLHGKAAASILKRFAALTGEPITPTGIGKLTDEQLRGAGLSRQKISYLRDLSEKAQSGLLKFEQLPSQSDEEVIKHLTRVKGIGVWTAHMFLMFALRRPDVLPTGDLGIQMAMRKLYRKRKLPKPEQMHKIAKQWAPYRSVACWYLWRSVDTKLP